MLFPAEREGDYIIHSCALVSRGLLCAAVCRARLCAKHACVPSTPVSGQARQCSLRKHVFYGNVALR